MVSEVALYLEDYVMDELLTWDSGSMFKHAYLSNH